MPHLPRPHLSEADRRLLDAAQRGIKLVPRPWLELGQRVGLEEAEVLRRLRNLSEMGVLRQVSAIFETTLLGYSSSLVAMAIDEAVVDQAASIINLHPGVSHNYHRNHRYNLWLTLAVPAGRSLGAEAETMAARVCAESTLLLPTLALYKIGVHFDLSAGGPSAAPPSTARAEEKLPPRALSEEERWAVALLQADLPRTEEPFAALAGDDAGAQRLLAAGGQLLACGLMRRFAAVLRHRRVGFSHNAMGVWVVPREEADRVGQVMAEQRAVSHCYLRPPGEDWPYTLYSMIHGRSAAECEAVAQAISAATGVVDYALLYSDREYKKVRVRAFTEDDDFDVRTLPALT